MAISMPVALPRMVPAYFSFSRWNKGHKVYPNSNNSVAFTQSGTILSPISLPRTKAIRDAFEMMTIFSEKDDKDIEADLNNVQKACEMLKTFWENIILVLMAVNPISRLLCDSMVLNDRFLRWSSFGAFYGVLLVLIEFVKMILWRSPPLFGFTNIVLSFLIYKANICNIALYRKGRHPFWLRPQSAFIVGKAILDLIICGNFRVLVCSSSKPLKILVEVESTVSIMMVLFASKLNDIFTRAN